VRRVLWITLAVVIGAVGYSAAWWFVAERTRTTIITWLDGLPAEQLSVTLGEMHLGGFPLAVRWTFARPRLEALWALGDLAVKAASLSLTVEIWAPRVLQLRANELVMAVNHEPTSGSWQFGAEAWSVTLEPGPSQAAGLRYELTNLIVDQARSSGRLVAAQHLATAQRVSGTVRISPRQEDGGPLAVHSASLDLLGFNAPAMKYFTPDGAGRVQALVHLGGDLGNARIEDVVAWRDAGGVLDIKSLVIDWPPVDIAFNGTLALDEQLRLLGAGNVDIRGLPGLIDKMAGRGELKNSQATIAKLTLALMTRPAKDGGAPVVRLPLTAQNGRLRAGPFLLTRLAPLIR
jgi:hypothetical protein